MGPSTIVTVASALIDTLSENRYTSPCTACRGTHTSPAPWYAALFETVSAKFN